MVAGHLREKKGYFYAVLNYTDAHGNRKTKWIATGLVVKGNKKRAEAFLQEQRRSFQEEVPITGGILFADFMEQWLTVIKSSVAVTTFASYSNMVKKVIVPYFRERQITLQELSAKHIQDFYLKELERVSASSVIHYHANIHKALKYAVKLDLDILGLFLVIVSGGTIFFAFLAFFLVVGFLLALFLLLFKLFAKFVILF